MKKEKGITLVALVITIIVLLILAGITLNLVIGENGLIARAQQAGKNTTEAQEAENMELANLENSMDKHISTTREQITVDREQYEQLLADVAQLKQNSSTASARQLDYNNAREITIQENTKVQFNEEGVLFTSIGCENGMPQISIYINDRNIMYTANAHTWSAVNNTIPVGKDDQYLWKRTNDQTYTMYTLFMFVPYK